MRDASPKGASHLPILIEMVQKTAGPILELGIGPYSTPVLHALAEFRDRKLISYENNEGYYNRFRRFKTKEHEINLIDDWSTIDIDKRRWSVAFIDHAPAERRKHEIRRLAYNTDFVVVHDTEPLHEDEYNYSEIYKFFKYRKTYKKLNPYTTVFSNVYGSPNS